MHVCVSPFNEDPGPGPLRRAPRLHAGTVAGLPQDTPPNRTFAKSIPTPPSTLPKVPPALHLWLQPRPKWHIAVGGTASTINPSAKKTEEHGSGGRLLAPMHFTPFAKEQVWYYTVTVTSISVGEHVLPSHPSRQPASQPATRQSNYPPNHPALQPKLEHGVAWGLQPPTRRCRA